MILMAASWPSNRLAAVTKRSQRLGFVEAVGEAVADEFATEVAAVAPVLEWVGKLTMLIGGSVA